LPPLDHVHVVLYTRQGCHLCEHASQVLHQARQRLRFSLSVVDVDGSLDLAARYGDCVPVVTVNGKVRFRGAVNRVLLARLLRAEGRRR
jgi:ABC-type hemin transport system ATPase subunit